MTPVGHITGFDISLSTSAASGSVMICITPGRILWPPGQPRTVGVCSVSIPWEWTARRVRVYLAALGSSTPSIPGVQSHPFFANVDSDQDTARGYYSDELVVVGHVDIPARVPPEPSKSEKPLDTRERASLLCIIGALAEHAKLDLSQPMKAGDAIAAMMPDVKLSGRTIGEHLKAVREAMDSRKG